MAELLRTFLSLPLPARGCDAGVQKLVRFSSFTVFTSSRGMNFRCKNAAASALGGDDTRWRGWSSTESQKATFLP